MERSCRKKSNDFLPSFTVIGLHVFLISRVFFFFPFYRSTKGKWQTITLTMHHEPPFVLDATVRDESVFRPAGQVFAVVIHPRCEGKNAQRLITGFGEL